MQQNLGAAAYAVWNMDPCEVFKGPGGHEDEDHATGNLRGEPKSKPKRCDLAFGGLLPYTT